MKRYHITNIALSVLVMLTAACSDEKEYKSGEPDAPDCLGVYFDESNETDFLFIPGLPSVATLNVHRLNTSAAVDVPLITEATTDALAFPKTVHFDQGSADAQIEIDFSTLPVGQQVSFSIGFPEQYISHYAATLFDFKATALLSKWEKANLDGSPVKFYFTSDDYTGSDAEVESVCYQPVESEMEVLPGSGMIRVINFLNSGVDMIFRLTKSPYTGYTHLYRVTPAGNMITMVDAYESDSYGDEWYNAWFIYDDAADDYIDANLYDLDGNSSLLEYPFFMAWSDMYACECSYLYVKGPGQKYNTVSMAMGGTPATNITIPSTFNLFFRWDGESGL